MNKYLLMLTIFLTSCQSYPIEPDKDINNIGIKNEIIWLEWQPQTDFVKKQIEYYKNILRNKNE